MKRELCTTRLATALLLGAVAFVAACSSSTVTTPAPPEDTLALCQDKIDNDNNGMTDCDDSSCSGSTDKAIRTYCLKNGDVKIGDTKGDADSGAETLVDDGQEIADDATSTGDTTDDTESLCKIAGTFGCPCVENSDCDSNYCIDGDQGKICTRECKDSCPTDFLCKQTNGVDAAWICVPAYPTLCMPCSQHSECQTNGTTGNYCVPFDYSTSAPDPNDPSKKITKGYIDGSFCMTACTPAKDPKNPGAFIDTCKSGYACQELKLFDGGKPVKQCVPISGQCGCHDAWAQEGKSTVCKKTSTAGQCLSKRQCTFNQQTGETTLSLCDAKEPSFEVCGDNEDNDCNGQTDEPGAGGCKNWYLDNDSDDYGTGVASTANCLCSDPGKGYSSNGGDCNDFAQAIHPLGVEICDNIDNDCDGATDESGSKGCTVFYKDLDGDGFGDPNNSACLCKSKQTSEWILQAADCDDTPGPGAAIHPGVDEICDGVDNNCNTKIDELGAIGCQLYYVDQDNDTYGVTNTGLCLCAASKSNTAGQPGDCDDSNGAVNPGGIEVCDLVDNDCNGKVDDGSADANCGAIAGGTSKCVDGQCAVGTCYKGEYDVDPTVAGCECKSLSNTGNLGLFCGNAIDLGVLPDGSATIQKAGQILPGEGGDWYKFNATDAPDIGTSDGGNCDQYDVRISFMLNPGDLFVFDVYRGSCGSGDQVCSAETKHDWSTSFYGPPPFGPKNKATSSSSGTTTPSPFPEKGGECNCVPASTAFKPCIPTIPPFANPKDDPALVGCGPGGLPGMNICTDNSSMYFVRVYTKPGAALTCDQYIIQFNNSNATGGPPPQN